MEQGSLGAKFWAFVPKDTLDRLILSSFQKQNIKNKHNIDELTSQNFACLVLLRVPYWQFRIHFECQITYKIGLNFAIV